MERPRPWRATRLNAVTDGVWSAWQGCLWASQGNTSQRALPLKGNGTEVPAEYHPSRVQSPGEPEPGGAPSSSRDASSKSQRS